MFQINLLVTHLTLFSWHKEWMDNHHLCWQEEWHGNGGADEWSSWCWGPDVHAAHSWSLLWATSKYQIPRAGQISQSVHAEPSFCLSLSKREALYTLLDAPVKKNDYDNNQLYVLKKRKKSHLMIQMANSITLEYGLELNQPWHGSRIWLSDWETCLFESLGHMVWDSYVKNNHEKYIIKTRNAETYGTLFLITWEKMLPNRSTCLLVSKANLSLHLFSRCHYYSVNRIWRQGTEIAQFLANFPLILLKNHYYNDFIHKSHSIFPYGKIECKGKWMICSLSTKLKAMHLAST